MRVFLDMDGVVADFMGGAMVLHGKPFPYDDPANRGDHGWGFDQSWGLPQAEFWAPMGYSFWADLPKTREADAVVQLLSTAFGPNNVCFLTSPCHTPGCVEGKRDWVRRYYPQLPILFSVASPDLDALPPKQFLAHNKSLLIDDHTPNVWSFREAGGVAYLFPRPWNRNWRKESVVVADLRSYVDDICQEEACLL